MSKISGKRWAQRPPKRGGRGNASADQVCDEDKLWRTVDVAKRAPRK
ncbi:MAG TPA: hypothetical protein PK156_36765 [Polyangium sp.]|nr:hypothetical protein [Polyangium sp.]